MNCKIDHADPEAFPRFLCRTCNPELVPSPEALAQATERDRAQRADVARRQELLRTQAKLNALEARHHGDVGGIDARIAKSLKRKIERLEDGDEEQSEGGSARRVRKRKPKSQQGELARGVRASVRRTVKAKRKAAG